jgi:hypothetical protein
MAVAAADALLRDEPRAGTTTALVRDPGVPVDGVPVDGVPVDGVPVVGRGVPRLGRTGPEVLGEVEFTACVAGRPVRPPGPAPRTSGVAER